MGETEHDCADALAGVNDMHWSEMACANPEMQTNKAPTDEGYAAPDQAPASQGGHCKCKDGEACHEDDNFGMAWCYIETEHDCADALAGVNDMHWSKMACANLPADAAPAETSPEQPAAPSEEAGTGKYATMQLLQALDNKVSKQSALLEAGNAINRVEADLSRLLEIANGGGGQQPPLQQQQQM